MSQQQTPAPSGLIPTWTVADRLRKAREHVGLSQIQFAAETGISRQTVGNYENGNTKPNRVFVAAWAMRTGVPIEWLMTGEEPSDGPEGPGTQAEPSSACVTADDATIHPLIPKRRNQPGHRAA